MTRLRATDEDLLASIEVSPIASVVSNPRLPDNPIVAVNAAFCALTLYDPSEIIGRNCRFLAGPHTEPWLTDRIRQGALQRKPTLVEILNYKRDGTPFRNAVLVAPSYGPEGELAYFVGCQVEVEDDDARAAVRRRYAQELIRTLSPRQFQILQRLSHGLCSKEIGRDLKIAERTVKMHRALLLAKLGKSTTTEAVRLAVEAGI